MAEYKVHLEEEGEEYSEVVTANGVESAKKRARVGKPYANVVSVEVPGEEGDENTVVEAAQTQVSGSGAKNSDDSSTGEAPPVSVFLTVAGWLTISAAAMSALYVTGEFGAGMTGLYIVFAGGISGALLIAAAQGLWYLKAIHCELQRDSRDQ